MPPNPELVLAVYRCNTCGDLMFTDPVHERVGGRGSAHSWARHSGFADYTMTYVGTYRLMPA